MFVDEIAKKLKLTGEVMPFCVTILGHKGAYVSGVKTVVLTEPNTVKLAVKKGVLSVVGAELKIVEIGGGDVYIEGEVESVEIK